MKNKTSDFKEDILRLRFQGSSYEDIAIWLATHKKFGVTAGAIRAFVKKQEMIDALKK
ncbi:hypothetical protein [Arsenophonus sp.]|uniref:hypothetical protein n=1 Tax=Arsenophonus sp. TaxID=1872640 RepID=UPI00286597B2|nr:hypothetical protein [Arsenophonus sp.]MDR5617882.1 hypothetical protein [Arsenophonus sp.]MDR5617897.1 hypothetical protein [Arsenophonus sp.]MDR5617921.1 hypothetical protein [Arsenophonus sp.]MDR5617936.1 hypothetical protein [Arsenophonus sp.]